MTANYRNNNNEEDEYGYTYLDFFKDIDSILIIKKVSYKTDLIF